MRPPFKPQLKVRLIVDDAGEVRGLYDPDLHIIVAPGWRVVTYQPIKKRRKVHT